MVFYIGFKGRLVPCKGGTLPIELIAQRSANYSIPIYLSHESFIDLIVL